MKKIDKQIMKTVLEALHWNEQQYVEFIYSCGLAYLVAYIPGYPKIISEISKTETFWDWWKDHWEKREMEFIETITDYPESVTDVLQVHKDLHDPLVLAGAEYLNGQVLQESYVSLINNITKNKTKPVQSWQI